MVAKEVIAGLVEVCIIVRTSVVERVCEATGGRDWDALALVRAKPRRTARGVTVPRRATRRTKLMSIHLLIGFACRGIQKDARSFDMMTLIVAALKPQAVNYLAASQPRPENNNIYFKLFEYFPNKFREIMFGHQLHSHCGLVPKSSELAMWSVGWGQA